MKQEFSKILLALLAFLALCGLSIAGTVVGWVRS